MLRREQEIGPRRMESWSLHEMAVQRKGSVEYDK